MSPHNDPHDVMARHLIGSMVLLFKCHRINAVKRYKRVSAPVELTIPEICDATDFFLRESAKSRQRAYAVTVSALAEMMIHRNQSCRLFLLDTGIDFEKELLSDFNIFTMEESFRQAELCLLQSPLSIRQPLFNVFPDLEAAIRLRSHPVPWITPLSEQAMRDETV
jgi:hypothetical protein